MEEEPFVRPVGSVTDGKTFTAASGARTEDSFKLAEGDHLIHFDMSLSSSSGPVLARATILSTGQGHILALGWLRGSVPLGSFNAIAWSGDILLPTDPRLEVSVQNNTGVTVTMRYSWLVVKG